MVIFDKIAKCNNVPLVKEYFERYYEITNLNYNSSIDSYNKKNIAKAIDEILSRSSEYLTRNNYKTPYNNESLQELSNILESQKFRKIFYSKKIIKDVIQEVHNRFATKLGTPAVYVEIKNSKEQIMSLEQAYNLKYNNNPDEENVKINYSKQSRSQISLYSILHETKHSQQYYSFYKLAKGAKLNNAEKVSAYFSFHSLYSNLDDIYNSPDFSTQGISEEKLKYDLDFAEIDANIYAINTLEKMAEKGIIKLTLTEFLQINLEKFNIINNFAYNRTVKDNKLFQGVKGKMQLTINRLIKDVNSLNDCKITKNDIEKMQYKATELLWEAKEKLDEQDFNFLKKNLIVGLWSEADNNKKTNKASISLAKSLNELSFDVYYDFLEKTMFKYYMDLQVMIHDFEKANGIETNAFAGEGIKLPQDQFEIIMWDTYDKIIQNEEKEETLTK